MKPESVPFMFHLASALLDNVLKPSVLGIKMIEAMRSFEDDQINCETHGMVAGQLSELTLVAMNDTEFLRVLGQRVPQDSLASKHVADCLVVAERAYLSGIAMLMFISTKHLRSHDKDEKIDADSLKKAAESLASKIGNRDHESDVWDDVIEAMAIKHRDEEMDGYATSFKDEMLDRMMKRCAIRAETEYFDMIRIYEEPKKKKSAYEKKVVVQKGSSPEED